MAKLIIDKKEFDADEGANLLHTALDNDIYIPNLCHLKEMEKPSASCRLCFVEIEGMDRPVPSCTVNVKDGMRIKTDTEEVRELQRTAFELLLSVHKIECKDCPANKKCELQNMARFLKVPLKQKRIEYFEREIGTLDDHPFLQYKPDKCVVCGKCTFVCEKENGHLYLSFSDRGLNTKISFFGETNPEKIPCDNCYACVKICPVGALIKKNN